MEIDPDRGSVGGLRLGRSRSCVVTLLDPPQNDAGNRLTSYCGF